MSYSWTKLKATGGGRGERGTRKTMLYLVLDFSIGFSRNFWSAGTAAGSAVCKKHLVLALNPLVTKKLDSSFCPLLGRNLLKPVIDFLCSTGTLGNGNGIFVHAPLLQSTVGELHSASIAKIPATDGFHWRNGESFPLKNVLEHLFPQLNLKIRRNMEHIAATTLGIVGTSWFNSVGRGFKDGKHFASVVIFMTGNDFHLGNFSGNQTR